MSSCKCFKSIDQVKESFYSRERTCSLIEWLTGCDRNGSDCTDSSGACDCAGAEIICHLILNAVRDACRPFLEPAVTRGKEDIPRFCTGSDEATYSEEFPPLAGLATPGKPSRPAHQKFRAGNSKVFQKKRVRPQLLQSSSITSVARTGNLTHIAPSDEPLVPAKYHQMKPKDVPSSPLIPKVHATTPSPQQKPETVPSPGDLGVSYETIEDMGNDRALANMIEVYVALINNCLVPSLLKELSLAISALNASGHCCLDSKSGAFSDIISSTARCNYFGAQTIRRLTHIIQGIGSPLMKQLIACSMFQSQLPELTESYRQFVQDSSGDMNEADLISSPQAALLTLPFDVETDSRHSYKTMEQQAIFRNREETRDRFLSNLRSFYNVRKGFDDSHAQQAHERVKLEARMTIDLLTDCNVEWFCDFFCKILLQVGLVPLEESDKEIMALTSQDKLFKLHQRFLDTTNRSHSTRKMLRLPPTGRRSMSKPELEAQHFFPGRQEFFFLFIRYADSYRIGKALLCAFAKRIHILYHEGKEDSSPRFHMVIAELSMLAKFLGLILFSSNWGLESSEMIADNMLQLEFLGISTEAVLQKAIEEGCLIATVPWLTECLSMAKWDPYTFRSDRFMRTLYLLQQVQREVLEDRRTPCNNLFIALCIERLLNDLPVETNVRYKRTAAYIPMPISGSSSDILKTDYQHLLRKNRDVEELIALITRLDRSNCSPLKSPGASRKVRPSKIDSPKTVDNGRSSFKSSLNPIHSKLSQIFFHQHQDLKEIFDVLLKPSLLNSLTTSVQVQVGEVLRKREWSTDDDQMVAKMCRDTVMQNLAERVSKALTLLLPAKDAQVISVAVVLICTHFTNRVDSRLANIISHEMEQQQGSSKKLIFDDSQDGDTSRSLWDVATSAIRRLTQDLGHFGEDKFDMTILQASLQNAIQALRELPGNSLNFPTDEQLRSFFECVYRMDRHCSHNMIQWSYTSDVSVTDRWALLHLFLDLAVSVRDVSQCGLLVFTKLLRSPEQLSKALALGLAADESVEKLSSLVISLVQKRIINDSIMKEALSAVSGLRSGRELSKRFQSLCTVEKR